MHRLKIPALASALMMTVSASAAGPLLPAYSPLSPQRGEIKGEGNLSIPAPARTAPRTPQRLGENSPLKPPFCETFDNFRSGMEHDDFPHYFQVIDSNDDDRTWGLYNYNDTARSGRSAYLLFVIDKPKADDWLVTRAIRLERGKYYNVSLDAGLYQDGSSATPETFEVFMGRYNDAEGLNMPVIGETKIHQRLYRRVDGWFTPSVSGNYYIGIHATSPRYNNYYNYLCIDNIAVSAPKEGTEPVAPSELTATLDPTDQLGLNTFVSFVVPSVALNGSPLETVTKVTVKRDNDIIRVFDNPVPGETLTLEDNPGRDGDYVYSVVASGPDGDGAEAQINHHAGLTTPLAPVVTEFRELADGDVFIKWDAPATDLNGNPIAPSLLTYNVYQYVENIFVPHEVQFSGTECSFSPILTSGDQDLVVAVVTAELNGRESTESASDYIAVGTPYPLPYHNSFTYNDYERYVLQVQVDDDVTWRMLDDFSDPDSQDLDNGYVCMIGSQPGQNCELWTGKIDLTTATAPSMSFYTFVYSGDENQIVPIVRDCETGAAIELPAVKLESFVNGGWQKAVVPLTDFAGKVVRIGLRGVIVTHGYIPVDNFLVDDTPAVDLSIGYVSAPSRTAVGAPFDIYARIENVGSGVADGYTISLVADGVTLESIDGPGIEPFSSELVELTAAFTAVTPEMTDVELVVDIDGDANTADNRYRFRMFCVRDQNPTVTDLTGEESPEGQVSLRWSAPDLSKAAPEEILEDFEAYPAFATSFGDWTCRDLDGGLVGAFSNIDMPVSGTAQAFWICESAGSLSFIPTVSGDKVVMGMYNTQTPNDDWLISPELYGGPQIAGFWARSAQPDYGLESIEIYWSEGSTDPADFVLLERIYDIPVEWTAVNIALPEGAKRFAVRYTSNDCYFLVMDDFSFIPAGAPRQIELKGYNVYRNGSLLTSSPVSSTSFETTRQTGGDTYVVTAVYDRGESAPSNVVAFGYAEIDRVDADTPAADAEYWTIQGRRVDSRDLLPGVYLRRQGSKVRKIIIR
ncbi:MAG: choice-of-anchor J domain-containing protein [Clostridium sp.]|nr:choice-of-anchor J domain-containing protein [Clostridium sp.]